MRNEADVWKTFKGWLPREVWAKRIEDASGDLGTFDTILQLYGRACWIEMKFVEARGRAIKYRKGQTAFAQQCMLAEMPCAVVCGCGDGYWRIVRPKRLISLEETEDDEVWARITKEKVTGLLVELGLPVL